MEEGRREGKPGGEAGREERRERIEREEKEGEVRGEKKRNSWPQQVCLGADYSNTAKQSLFNFQDSLSIQPKLAVNS